MADRLVTEGWTVRGVDCFTPFYDEVRKRANLAGVIDHPSFSLVEADLLSTDLEPLLDDVDVVFHLAGQPGVHSSWSSEFPTFVDLNVNVTQRLLEASIRYRLERFVYASSSSVYGDTADLPTAETHATKPFSPYGVTKLAGELLCCAYGANFGVPTTSVRYFTVYGPRQRPDMALHRMIEAALDRRPFPVFGDGSQRRDFTYVDDIVNATFLAAVTALAPATVVNAAGGCPVSITELIEIVSAAVGSSVDIEWRQPRAGDVRATEGDIACAKTLLGWTPQVGVADGVQNQVAWHVSRR
jgi:UDP-glucuronate 4-epimerase